MVDAPPSNGLRVSRRLERITLIDREGFFLLPAAKIAPIQPVGYTRLLGGTAALICLLASDKTPIAIDTTKSAI